MTFDELSSKEWLLTNGIGGFASGTLAGCATRRYHSLLTVALDPPSGRRMSLLGGLDETVIIDGVKYPLATHVYEDGTVFPNGWEYLTDFTFLGTVRHYHYEFPMGARLRKTVGLVSGENTLIVTYRLVDCPQGARLRVAPLVCWKDYHQQMRPWDGFPTAQGQDGHDWSIQATPDAPTLALQLEAFADISNGNTDKRIKAIWQAAGWWNERLFQYWEAKRGFPATESLYCPATAEIPMVNFATAGFVATIHPERQGDWYDTMGALRGKEYQPETPYTVAAPDGRTTILAGYPWFTDWGRDTFISLPGLCLTTSQDESARQIIRDFVPWVRNGRIPNRFPDNNDEPAYNNVDGTLWFLHCIGLCGLTEELSGTVEAILAAHLEGTVGDGIYCDSDGLLRCGDDHTNLTWMDAKVDGVAITPRYDRPVEVQALWINALRLAGETERAARAEATFLARFVRADGLGLYDCLLPDGTPDASIRPNQVIAAALLDLPAPVNQAILTVATDHLLTPFGLRTLSPTDSRFCPRYEGGPHQRDAAYHQGTVWPWLIGSFCDLYKKVHGPDADISVFLSALERHLTDDYGLGGIAEVFDGAAPHRPNGCPWQAWSLAEVLRARAL